MREMKDSGIEWIGKVPVEWKIDNPQYHFSQRKDRAKQGMVQLTASQKYGVITQTEYMERTGANIVTVQKDFDILKLVCAGDFVIHMRSFQGGLEYSEKTGSISIEPYPTPNIHEQNLEQLLERVSFADRIIFGRVHYNKQVTAYKGYQDFYNTCARKVIAFCEERKIAYHIKKGTLVE